jgi:hypothetical protein
VDGKVCVFSIGPNNPVLEEDAMNRIVTVGLLCAMVLCLAAGAYAESVKLEYRFTKGDVNKYNISGEINAKLPNMPGMPNNGAMTFKMSMLQVQKVMEVYPDGTA